MIEYIKGTVSTLDPTQVVLEAYGIGYLLHISLNTFTALQGKQEAQLYVEENLVTGGRDDAYHLYGFYTRSERDLYRLLTSVSGVGANSARMILSAMSESELISVIANAQDKMLCSVKGIGAKTAQRIIIDLKDKIMRVDAAQGQDMSSASGENINQMVKDEAVSAMVMLGFAPAPATKVIRKILTDNPNAQVEQVIKLALKMIK